MNKRAGLLFSILFVSLFLPANNLTWARGGGGGGGFHGGGGYHADYGRGYGRDDYGRGFAGGGRGDYGRGMDGVPASRDSAFSRDMPADFGRPGDDGVSNYGAASHANSFATDGGFGRISNSPTARNAGTQRVSSADLAARGSQVRNGFNNYNAFDHSWWQNHPNSWNNRYWGDRWAWDAARWDDLAGWWGGGYVDPVDYDYGDNISYGDDGQVYYGSTPTYTDDQYYEQAQNLAISAPPENTQPTAAAAQSKYAKEWKPLGVYALVQNNQSDSSQIMQLCTNKQGIIRGNYFNSLTNETLPIRGAVDKKAQRVSWIVGNNKTVVYDTGISNLLKPQSPILVHYNKDNTQQWMLVRLKDPGSKGQTASS